jgi:hypothetical protein
VGLSVRLEWLLFAFFKRSISNISDKITFLGEFSSRSLKALSNNSSSSCLWFLKV